MRKFDRTQLKKISRCTLASFIVIAILGILLVPNKKRESKPTNVFDYPSVNSICELATIRCFYHNVAMFEEKPDGLNQIFNDYLIWPFGKYSKVGYKQYWIEYSGIVEAGIDASQVQIKEPRADGVVEVFVPAATVLSVDADEETLTTPISEKGWFTTITGKDKAKAFSAAQDAMRQEAENDGNMLKQAEGNAKLLLENFIINTGKKFDEKYSVVWVSEPLY